MPIRFGLRSVTISDGTRVEVPEQGQFVFVGPNNTGKSAALREITLLLNRARLGPDQQPRVLVDIEIDKRGSVDELVAWLGSNTVKEDHGERIIYRRVGGGEASERALTNQWKSEGPYSQLVPFFTFSTAGEGRLGLAGSTQNFDQTTEKPTTPLQLLVVRPELEEELSRISEEAFGTGLTLNRVAGTQLHLHFGTTDVEPGWPPSHEYMRALAEIPKVQDQGDGVRSFIGLMLALVASDYPLIFVDEPEAFLHPPQARLLGRKLSTARPQAQVFVATHSIDVLQGLLGDPTGHVSIVRLIRRGDINHASLLSRERLRTLWADPLLRMSRVLDGLFHQGVVVCESDADAQFYSVALDAARVESGQPQHDLLFTHCGGKDRMRTVVDALRVVDVPVAVVADFDVLQDGAALERLFTSLGGDWSAVETDWNAVRGAVEGLGSAPLVTTVQEETERLLEEAAQRGSRLTRADTDRIRNVVRVNDSWSIAKTGGIAVVPGGDASERARRLLASLAERGLFVVEVGELERWLPAVPHHGPRWVVQAVEAGHHASDGPHRDFVLRVDDYLQG